jgi:MoaA/NifB/PqqE/SkfB family radical SAM enzyme
VLPCPYVHIKLGNIYQNSLKEISEFGFNIKHFNQYEPLCLSGEKKEFSLKYLAKDGTSIFKPLFANEIFEDKDFIDPLKKSVGGKIFKIHNAA